MRAISDVIGVQPSLLSVSGVAKPRPLERLVGRARLRAHRHESVRGSTLDPMKRRELLGLTAGALGAAAATLVSRSLPKRDMTALLPAGYLPRTEEPFKLKTTYSDAGGNTLFVLDAEQRPDQTREEFMAAHKAELLRRMNEFEPSIE